MVLDNARYNVNSLATVSIFMGFNKPLFVVKCLLYMAKTISSYSCIVGRFFLRSLKLNIPPLRRYHNA